MPGQEGRVPNVGPAPSSAAVSVNRREAAIRNPSRQLSFAFAENFLTIDAMNDQLPLGKAWSPDAVPSGYLLHPDISCMVHLPPVPARRGKCMSRRKGQNPKVRVGKRADGTKYYFFQYWIDVPGREKRKRMTVVLG